jgi:hypothetical protein
VHHKLFLPITPIVQYRNTMTFSKLQNLSPPRRYIKLSLNFHRSRIFSHELFLIRRLKNSRTPNNRRFFIISDFKIYLLRGYICKMAQIFIKYSSEHILEIITSFFAKTRNMIFWSFSKKFPSNSRPYCPYSEIRKNKKRTFWTY